MKFILIALLIAGVAYYFYSSSNNKKLAADNVRIGAEFLASKLVGQWDAADTQQAAPGESHEHE